MSLRPLTLALSLWYTDCVKSLQVEKAAAGYGAQDVLTNISLTVALGEFTGLIGPNGCGKSTLLRVVSGVLPLRRGLVRLEGRDLKTIRPLEVARHVAFVPQQEQATFDFTVRDMVRMGRYPYQVRAGSKATHIAQAEEDEFQVERALIETDALHLQERLVTELSGGEQRRVLLARALAQDTAFLLLDEPTTYLDITHQAQIMTLALRLARERNVGVLAALHDLNQAAHYCDRLTLMQQGRILAEGPPEAILTPDNLWQAYGATAEVGRNPVTGRPTIFALHNAAAVSPLVPSDTLQNPKSKVASPLGHVHVVCGGGTGGDILRELVRRGFAVSVGVLHEGDSDLTAARALGIEALATPAFAPIPSASMQTCREAMSRAETIIVAPVAFHAVNRANLELILESGTSGKSVVLVGATSFPASASHLQSDDAQITALWQRLLANDPACFDRIESWLAQSNANAPT